MLGGSAIGDAAIGDSGGEVRITQFVVEVLMKVELPLIETISRFDRQVVAFFHEHPNELKRLGSRQFEHFIAEIWDGLGYKVELTKQTRDGGIDIIAVKHQEADLRFLIQTKRMEGDNPVNVSVVRETLGVHVDEGATKSIIATTTRFTKDALNLVEKHKWVLEARDFAGVHDWIQQYMKLTREG